MEALGDARFYRLSHIVQPILYFARLFSDRIEWAWVTRRIAPRGAPELVLEAQVVACGPSYLRHIDVRIIQTCWLLSRHVEEKHSRPKKL